jgi:hypothetical protein
MAIGTLTVVNALVDSPGKLVFEEEITLVGDGSYPTGGMAGIEAAYQTAGKHGRAIIDIKPIGVSGGYLAEWDKPNKKLKLYTSNGAAPAAFAELANATNLSGTTFRLLVRSI